MPFEVLDPPRKELFKKLGFLKKWDFYLAGGTALALQISHRTSADFDFYTRQSFEPLLLWTSIQKELPSAVQVRVSEGTLIALIDQSIEISFFHYDYPLLQALVPLPPVELASLMDIAAMKIVAIAQRGIRRDFVDLYFLSKKLGLFEIIGATLKKYKGYDVYTILQSLCYFEDAEGGVDRPYQLFQELDWKEVKNYFVREVRRVEKLF